HHSIRSGGIRCAQDCTEIVWIFYSIENYEKRMIPPLGGDHVSQIVVLLGRGDRDNSLVRGVSSHAVEFSALQKPDGHTQTTAILNQALQAQIVALFGHTNPLERAPTGLERFADGVDAVNVVHD